MSDPSGSREGSNLDEGSSASGSFSELDIRWATRALDRLGVVGREDLESALTSLVEAKVAGNFLKPPRRWGWHLISSALFFAFLLATGLSDETVGTTLLGLWLISVSSHFFWTIHSFERRIKKLENARKRLRRLLDSVVAQRTAEESRRRRVAWDQAKEEQGLPKDESSRQWEVAQVERETSPFEWEPNPHFQWTNKREVVWGESVEAECNAELPNLGPKPEPYPLGVSPDGAEKLCAQWMEHLGQINVRVTRSTIDGGVDIESSAWLAQVKHYRGAVGVTEVRELVGVASIDGRTPVFFTSGQYTSSALEFADKAGVLLFSYQAETGTLRSKNAHARRAYRP